MKALLLLLPFALAACTAAPDSTTPAATPAHSAVPMATTTTLARHHWQLHDAVDGNNQRLDGLFGGPSDKPLQLGFSADQIRVRNACNSIGGSYRIVDGHLDSGPLRQTMMACTDPVLMERESTITDLLRGKPTLILAGTEAAPLMTLTAASGQTLTFAGKPTAETRYNGPGETVFLEVAPGTAPCPHPLMPDTACLQVRERHYDAHGLRAGEPGPWQSLQQDIEGYAHEPGIRNVLRLKRYAIRNPPGDAPSTAYVLDMVVESEAVEPSDPKHP